MGKSFNSFITVIVSGLAYYFSFGFHHNWFLMWIAPIPLLIYTFGTPSFSRAILISLLITPILWLNIVIGYGFGLAIPSSFIESLAVQTLEWTSIILISRYFVRKTNHPSMLLIYPILLSILEFIQSITSQGTFYSISVSQLNILPVIQIASITGFIGITFILSLFASAIATTIIIRNKIAYKYLTITICSIAICISYGYWKINHLKSEQSIIVGAVTINDPLSIINTPQMAESIINEYTPFVNKLAHDGAQFIVLPEKAFAFDQKNYPNVIAQLSNLAKANSITLIVGVRDKSSDLHHNNVLVFNPTGQLIGQYSKKHFIPNLEHEVLLNNKLLTFQALDNYLAGIAICRDMDYTDPANQYGFAGTNILFVPASDFITDARVHWSDALMRGVENGYTLVRVARNGMLSVTSPTGEMIAQIDATGNKASLLAKAPLMPNTSFYAKHPYWFLITLIIIFLILILFKCLE